MIALVYKNIIASCVVTFDTLLFSFFERTMGGKKRLFNFVINNYTDEDITSMKTLKVASDKDAWVVAYEVGENGTPHLQGAFYFANARSFNSIQKKLKRANICESNGKPPDVLGYCCKGDCPKDDKPEEGWRAFDWVDKQGPNLKLCWCGGVPPKGQGNKSVFAEIVEDRDFTMRSILQDERSTSQSLCFANKYLELLEPCRMWKTEVIVHFGPTGRGKDHDAKIACGASFDGKQYSYPSVMEKPYTKSSGGKWWFGYDGHEDVILTDFRDCWFMFTELLNILEGEYVVECKGGNRQFRPRRMFITCPEHPRLWYSGKFGEDRNQLMGRISKIVDYNGKMCHRIGSIQNDTV